MEEQVINTPKESIKLSKMSKGYNWDIRIVAVNPPHLLEDEDLERLEKLDNQLREKYGEQK